MSFFQWLWGKKEVPKQTVVSFGRYTDAYKTAAQLAFWEKSRIAFEENNFFESSLALLAYIRDEQEDNVQWKISDDGATVNFELIQGSQRVGGFFNQNNLQAEVKIANASALNVGLLRRLIDQSALLAYSAYAISPDNTIVIRFSTNALDGSPYKIFHGLKEIAVNADKQDDLLLHDFDILKIVDASLRIALPEEEKEFKYGYLMELIRKAFEQIDTTKINLDQQPKTASYLLLDVIYKTEYLIGIEGFSRDIFEQAQYEYFASDGKNVQQKNTNLRKALQKIAELPKAELLKEMYKTKATFSIAQSVTHDTFVQHFDAELPQIDWYYRNNHYQISEAVINNIVGFCQINCTLPKPDRQLLQLYYMIMENNYFKNLGIDAPYTDANAVVIEKNVSTAFQHIMEENKPTYPFFKPNVELLDFSSSALFARSYLMMMRDLDMRKA